MLHRLPLRFPDTRDQFRCAPILLFVQTIVALLLPCRPALAAPVAPVPVPGPVPATASVPADLDPATIDGRPGCLGITPGGGTALFLVETLRLPGGLELELRPVNPAGDELPELVSWRQMLASCESGEISPAALRRSCAQAVSAGLARTLPPLRERLRAARLRPCIQAEPPGHGLRIGRKIVRFAERHQPDGDVEITLDGVRLLQLPQGVVEQDPVEIKELPDPAPGPADTSAPGEALRSAPPPPAVEPVSMQESHLQGVYTGPVARSLFVAVRSLTLEPLADDPRTLVQATLTTTIRSFTWRQLRRVDCAPVAGRPAYPDLTTALEPVPEGYERSDEEYIGPQICQGLTPDGRAGWFLVGENESHLGETGDFVETSKWRHVLLGDRRQLPRGRPRRLVPCLETQPDRPFRVLDRRGRLEGSHVVLDDGEPTFVTELTYCEGPG
ncbi:MAG: hypothetical protein FJ125_12870, partial [Deltaproteobacteria bacterium]|nr:hypothetical protein [Deltaproteobacteria bacterium]